MRVLVSLEDQPLLDTHTLFGRLWKAGIYPVGCAVLGYQQRAILFSTPEHTDQAIAILKQMGIDAKRG